MTAIYFVLGNLVVLILALWFMMRMIINSSPAIPANVGIVLFLLFMVAGSLVSLTSWLLIRRFWQEERFVMALRHGAWAGLFIVTLPLLRWLQVLNLLVAGAVLLVIFGLESLILLQQPEEEG